VSTATLQAAALNAVNLGILPDNLSMLHEIAVRHSLSADDERILPDLVSDIGLMRRAGIFPQPVIARPVAPESVSIPLIAAGRPAVANYTNAPQANHSAIVVGGPDAARVAALGVWLLQARSTCVAAQSENGGAIRRGTLWASFNDFYSGMTATATMALAEMVERLNLPPHEAALVNAFRVRLYGEEGGLLPYAPKFFLGSLSALSVIFTIVACTVHDLAIPFGITAGVAAFFAVFLYYVFKTQLRKLAEDCDRAETEYVTGLGLRIVGD
jgi:hypothetical protein